MSDKFFLSEDTYLKRLNVEDALAAAAIPASGAYIDVSKYTKFGFVIMAGALDSELTFTVQQAATISGTLKDVTGATTVIGALEDDCVRIIEVETNHLDINNGYNFVTLKVAGYAGGNDYAAIAFYGKPRNTPAVQDATTTVVVVAG